MHNLHRVSRSIFITVFVRILSMFGFFIEYRLFSKLFGLWGFSTYSTIRRFNDTFSPLITLCWGRSLMRFVSSDQYSKRSMVLILGVGISMTAMGAAIVVLLMDYIPQGLFPGSDLAALKALKAPVSLLLFAMSLYSIIYSLYWSLLKTETANRFSVVAINLIPIFSVSLGFWISFRHSLFVSAALIIVWCVFALSRILKNWSFSESPKIRSRHFLNKFYFFGITRTPGVVLNGCISLLPILDMYRLYGFKEVGYFNALAALTQIPILVTEAAGLILFPRLAKNAATSPEANQPYLSELFGMSLFIGLMGMICFYWWAPSFTEIWLTSNILEGRFASNIMCVAVPSAILYSLFRNVVDAQSLKPWNFLMSLLGVAVYFAFQNNFGGGVAGIATAWVLARLIQGFGLFLVSFGISRFPIHRRELFLALIFTCLGVYLPSGLDQGASLLILPLVGAAWLIALRTYAEPSWLNISF